MEIYKTRYAADKARKAKNIDKRIVTRIVLVKGGYTLMTEQEYQDRKKQK